ncbi:hypothetical protein Pint_30406 [Pistacia integerrima]|uniref:Uncharacterized protein n=1 Tax=Pistacia integerrima TaxID=434235 RepID=A0ACC0WY64_9ROSI|nr:hypothetical protein Pint_30406 [Pistacia integerrima]
MKILKRRLGELNSRKEDVELRLSMECNMGKLPKAEVNNWLQNTKRINEEAEDIERQVNKVEYFSRGHLGKLVDEKIKEVKDHHQNGAFESLVIDAPQTAGLVLPTTTLVGETTAKKNMNEIWELLMGDEVMKIGVCGMGGIGKTTIITHINNKLLKEMNKFEKVIWVTVSQPLDLLKLQDQIAAALKENLPRNEDKRIRAGNLLKMLEGRKIVLLLDDMWEAFKLEEVGIPEPTKDSGCKLVITTRSQDVCRYMGCKIVKVRCLLDDEALTLFIDKVELNIFEVPALKDIVKLVVEQCARLPLAIVTVACCMRREYDICEWRNALEELSKSIQSVKGMETNVLGQLQFSYDRLKSKKVQHCFLYCALYPKYFKILKEELIVYWIAEGLVDERASMQATYDGAYSILNRLVNNCLLETIDDGRCVKMHDLLREMALDITSMSPLFMVKAGEKLQEFPREQEWKENLEKASLMRNNISEIPPNMSPNCQALSTLLLQENVFLKNIPESFFIRMQGLNILNLSYTIIEKLPDSISHLTNLTALLLQYCEHIKHVPCLAKLLCLQNLDLEGTQITEVPEGMEMLQKLRYLNLFSVYLEKLPAGMLSKLNCVQKLRVYWGSKTSEEMVEEASKLSELDILEACFRKIEDFKIYVKSLGSGGPRLRKYSLTVGLPSSEIKIIQDQLYSCYSFWPPIKEVDRFVEFNVNFVAPPKDLQCLTLNYCNTVTSLSDVLSNEGDYSDLKAVHVRYCKNLKELLSGKLLRALPNLEVIEVSSCNEIEEIIRLDVGEEKSEEDGRSNTTLTLPKLKILRLCYLFELNRICSSNGVIVCDSLKQIEVLVCPKLKRLPLSLPLPAIEEIKGEEEWWDSLEWDNPNAKNALQPFIKYIFY